MIFDFHIRPYYFHLLDNKCLTVYIVNDLSNKFHCTEIDTCSLLPHNEVRHLPLLSVHQFALVVLGAIIAQLIQYHVRYVWFKSRPLLIRVTPGFSQLKKTNAITNNHTQQQPTMIYNQHAICQMIRKPCIPITHSKCYCGVVPF